jgi:ATP/maltotriose-dependent transcriptional regulator MalT
MNRLFVTGHAQQGLGNLDVAESSFREQLELARKHEHKPSLARGLTKLAEVQLARGDLEEARRLSAEARERLHDAKRQDMESELAVDLLRARIAFEQGQLEEAARLTSEAVSMLSGPITPAIHHMRARIALAQGNLQEAHTALLQATCSCSGSGSTSSGPASWPCVGRTQSATPP